MGEMGQHELSSTGTCMLRGPGFKSPPQHLLQYLCKKKNGWNGPLHNFKILAFHIKNTNRNETFISYK